MDTLWLQLDAKREAFEKAVRDNLSHTDIWNLTTRQIHVLIELFENDKQHASALAKAVQTQATSFTPVLDRLEEMDLILRSNDPNDRRAKFVHLKPKAESLRGAIVEALAQAEKQCQ